jgi:transcriptional regulator with XRE-family HTH domain
MEHDGRTEARRADAVARQLGAAIRARRLAEGLNQDDLAAYLGVPRQAVIRLEAGEHPEYLARLVAALELLGMDLQAVPR